jgi:transposase-like protein
VARRQYSDVDKAAVYLALKVNGGTVAASSRDANVPEQTVRDWKNKWESGEWEPPSQEAFDGQVENFVADMERVRNKALLLIEQKLDQIKNPEKLATVVGILDDKIRLAKGLATSRSESTLALPSAEEMGERLLEGARIALEKARERDADIIDVDLDEQSVKELAPAP